MPNDDQPRIAICLEYSIMAFGGTEVLVAELVRALSAFYRITLVSGDPSLLGTWAESLVEHHIAWPRVGGGDELAARLRALKVELAHFHGGGNYAWGSRRLGASPILAVRRAGIRCLTTNHGFFSPLEGYCAQYRSRWLKLALFPAAWLAKIQLLGAVDCEIAVSRYDERELRRWYCPYAARFRQIYHSQLPRTAENRFEGVRRKRILCVGTLGHRKGQPILAEAFARLADQHSSWELLFAGRVGADDVWSAVCETVRRNGLEQRVQRVEGLTHEEIAQLMRDSEIFVLPSVFEGLGLSLQEALYHGCACISTRSGGPEDLIEDGSNGLLVAKDCPDELADAITRLITDQQLRARFQEEGPRYIARSNMNATSMVSSYHQVYREILPR